MKYFWWAGDLRVSKIGWYSSVHLSNLKNRYKNYIKQKIINYLKDVVALKKSIAVEM